MNETTSGHNYLQKFYRDLRLLEPFLQASQSLSEDAKHLADFVRRSLPICRIALVRVNGQGELKEVGYWENGSQGCRDVFDRIMQQGLSFFWSSLQKGEEISDQMLFQMIQQAADHDLGCYPTILPIHCEQKMVGFALFGKECGQGEWSQEEKGILQTIMTAVSLSFSNKIYNEEYKMQSWVFNAMMDNMSASVYVTDIDSDRILFMNRTMKKAFGLKEPEGKVCWELLQEGMSHRCDFCPLHNLGSKGQKKDSYLWEEINTCTGRVYENYDSLIPWIDGRLVHFQQSVDITETKKLNAQANTDELTEMMNRRAGKLALKQALEEARKNTLPLTVCMYDVNILKEVNDAFGHAEGDDLIVCIAKTVKSCLTGRDFSFRMSGDEFVIVLQGCGEKQALRRIAEIRHLLNEENHKNKKPYDRGFCCGVFEISPYEDFNIQEVLSKVDERMYEQKRRFHIEKAERERLLFTDLLKEEEPDIHFDSQYLYDALVESTEDYVYMCDMKTNTFRYPKAMVKEFMLPGEVVKNAAAIWGAKVHESDKLNFLESNQEVFDGRSNNHSVEYRAKNRRGEWVWLRCRGYLKRDEMGEPRLFAGMISNLNKKNRLDRLTGLYNKFEFEEVINDRICDHPESRFGVMLLGLDEFKHINDLYDRAFGDEILRITAQRIESLLPVHAEAYRMDGDEFGVVVDDVGEKELLELYSMLHREFGRQQQYNGKKYFCTLSAGVVLYPRDAESYLELSRCAGYALEIAKHNGKNQLTVYSKDLLRHRARSLALTELLRESVENGFENFSLYYQPQVCADTRKLKGVEALARWHCDAYGNVPPMEFIPLLEESGLIHPVGRWIFMQAVADCARWMDKAPDFTMSINLSYLQLMQPDFISFMQETMEKYQVDPSRIVVEITESCIASSIDMLSYVLREIRSLRVKIAMDDFGTGYSSLEILKNCPADIVKISRAFVADIQKSNFDATFIRFIVSLCHDVDIRVCLEGVEDPEEYRTVAPMALDYIQGYLFGRPMPASEFEHYREVSNF